MMWNDLSKYDSDLIGFSVSLHQHIVCIPVFCIWLYSFKINLIFLKIKPFLFGPPNYTVELFPPQNIMKPVHHLLNVCIIQNLLLIITSYTSPQT